MSDVVDFEDIETPQQGFEARQSIWDLGNLAFTRAIMPGNGVVRHWHHKGRAAIDHWCLVLVGGAPQLASGRSLHFRSLGRPFDGSGCDASVLTLYIPRDLFGGASSMLDRVPNAAPDTGLAGLLADYMASLDQRLDGIQESDLSNLATATRDLVAACLLPTADRLAAANDAISLTLLERARRCIRSNLHSPAFGPDQLIRQLFISRSRLYRLFEPFGGVARYIQRQRLIVAHAGLSDPVQAERTILQIAEGVGFVDASSFSRAFKQEFGHSPSEARSSASLGLPLSARQRHALHDRSPDLGNILSGLHA